MGENPANPVPANIFDSGASTPLTTGQSFTYKVMMNAYTFNKDHAVAYYCRIHPVMTAALTITLT